MPRFKFGSNWRDYLQTVSETDIKAATESLAGFLGMPSLTNKSFLDIGCGSGLHSLAAFRLGAASIVSLDYDSQCVECTQKLQEQAGKPTQWIARQGDILTD